MNWPIREINIGEAEYPKILSELPDRPKKLYVRGNIELLKSECLAIVGTRKMTEYGRQVTEKIGADLSRAGFTIVSGLALGIDAVAHQAALDSEGKTIAVLGGGVDDGNIGPRANFPLAKQILQKDGLLISEYSSGEKIFPANFAVRDRIISGLSLGVLVVEADEKSGALITARCALDQNRDVFAVPGSIFSSRSLGPNKLIKSGAKPVSSAQDIIEDYGQNLRLFNQPAGGKKSDLSTNDPVQKIILDILDKKSALNTDQIITQANLETSKVLAALSMLELENKIKSDNNGLYRLNI